MARREELLDALREKASCLFEMRQKAGGQLSQAINGELADLDMKNAAFAVEVSDKPVTSDHVPVDPHRVRFTIAPNPGEPAMPLVSIVSGGEASRVLLAIKTILSGLDQVATMIFDEIDTGISGSTTTRIAGKLKTIARSAQVLCVTHSAQIAAAADCHLLIGKEVEGGRTRTTVRRIEGEARLEEIARLLSGRPKDESSLLLAADLLALGTHL